jgi:UV damage endonuclease UvdE
MDQDYRIGFACKIVADIDCNNINNKKQKQILEKKYNTKSTTITFLQKFNKNKQIEKLVEIAEQNAIILANQMKLVGSWPKFMRMMRISSDIWPGFTHADFAPLYQKESELQQAMNLLQTAGNIAKQYDIRLSMHPGQFTMLVSQNRSTVEKSIEDLEYHAEIFRRMGISYQDQRTEINIHGGAKVRNFHQQFLYNFRKLAFDTQQWLSVENDEFSYGIEDLLPLAEHVKICIDLHHYWLREEKYLEVTDPIIPVIINSWRGVRPELHMSTTHELFDGKNQELPNFQTQKIIKSKWRRHSNYCYNSSLNEYVLTFITQFDIMVEAKMKNLAAKQLLEQYIKKPVMAEVI